MSIDDVIRYFDDMKKACCCGNEQATIAIDTMHKYQKIEQIYSDWNDGRFSDAVFCLRVKAVLNGNDD